MEEVAHGVHEDVAGLQPARGNVQGGGILVDGSVPDRPASGSPGLSPAFCDVHRFEALSHVHRVAVWSAVDWTLNLASGIQEVDMHLVAELLIGQLLAVPATARTGQSEIQDCEFA